MWATIAGMFLGKNPLSEILGAINNSVNNETRRDAIVADAVKAHMQGQADIRLASMQSNWFWYVWVLFAAPLGFWWAAVMLDTVLPWSWGIPNFPDTVRPWAETIFQSIFGSGAAVGSAQAIASAIRGRR